MKHRNISSCYYPTLAVLIDDNQRFLTNISFELDAKLAYRLYEKPIQALQFLKEECRANPLATKCLSSNAGSENYGLKTTYHAVNVDLEAIYKEIYNQNRFNEVSVLIVDYSMPEMNGLEICKQLMNTPIKKIMVTGEADETLAVHAFNEGIIDRFILKNSPGFGDAINNAISELQKKYFLELSQPIIKNLITEPSSCLDDPQFVDFFHQLCQENQISEFYLIENTGSFLLLNYSGKPSWLIVKNESDLQMYYDMAEDYNAPASVLDDLRNYEKIPYFSRSEDYHAVKGDDWKKYLYPAKQLKAKRPFYYSLIKETPMFFDLDHSKILSYKDYLGTVWPPVEK